MTCFDRQFFIHQKIVYVNILITSSNYYNFQLSYAQIFDVNVQFFKFRFQDLNVNFMFTLICVNQFQVAFLYIDQITKILRDMTFISFQKFDYIEFKRRVQKFNFFKAQKKSLQQRLELLKFFFIFDDSIRK